MGDGREDEDSYGIGTIRTVQFKAFVRDRTATISWRGVGTRQGGGGGGWYHTAFNRTN